MEFPFVIDNMYGIICWVRMTMWGFTADFHLPPILEGY